MRALILAAILIVSCGGGELRPDCGTGREYCVGHDAVEMCCGGDHPFCGRVGTTCPVGYCCESREPLD